MQDGIIKGTGNSRYLKSVADFLTRYPKYEDMVAALVAGTLPIDLNGINTAGWSQQATALNKSTLLSDSTETAIWGNTGNRTVDAALAKLIAVTKALSYADLKIVTGSYTGSGTTNKSSKSISLSKAPKLVYVAAKNSATNSNSADVVRNPIIATQGFSVSELYGMNILVCTSTGFTVTYGSINSTYPDSSANGSGKYYYCAII